MADPTSFPVIGLHGFTQNRRCWGPFGDRLDSRAGHGLGAFEPIDLPGHGTAADLDVDLWEGSRVIAEALDGPAVLIGYSMGGRFALHLALARPDLVAALVLIGANPGIADPAEREQRRRRDIDLATRLEEVGVEAFCDEWLALPMFAGLTPATSFVEERRTNTVAGLSSSLRRAGTGSQDDLWPRLGELDRFPVLALAGALDVPYSAVVERMGAARPFIETRTISEAGHAAHLERPDETADIVIDWLTRVVLSP